jgi:two-component system phosphate regulon response regulator PhoB
MLPGLDGIEVCRQLREQAETKRMPIVMLTARGEEEDIVKGLNAGADDYVTKPFSPKVLVARLKAVLRRNARVGGVESEEVRIHDITIHAGRHEVRVKGVPVTLTPTEFRLLHYLAQRPGWVFTRNQIVVAVHGYGYPVTDRSVDVQVVGLRKKLGEAGEYVETVRGVGYRFQE